MQKRYIAISQRLYSMQNYHEVREALAIDWGIFFTQYLSDFLMLPLSYKQDVTSYLPYIAGVILSGGNDLSICNNTPLNKERDIFEMKLITLCLERSIPLLGICRGAQIIGHYFGATINACINHVGTHKIMQNLDIVSHLDSMQSLYQHKKSVCDKQPIKTFQVNSFHNYAIQSLGKDLIALASYGNYENLGDFSIEAFMHNTHTIFGIMWHIERENGMQNSDIFYLWKHTLYNEK